MPNFPFVAANIIRYMAFGPTWVRRIHGYNAQAANVWIQLHETPPLANGTLTAGTIPNIKSLETTPANGFDYEFVNSIKMSECLIALSTAEANYTAVGAGGGLDMTVELDSDYLATAFPPTAGTLVTVTGDLTTTVNNLTPWTELQGPNRLLRVDVTEQLGAARFVAVIPFNSINNINSLGLPLGQVVPPGSWAPLPANSTVNMSFGRRGLIPYARDAGTNLEHKGCSIVVIDNATTFAQSANSAVIRTIHASVALM